MEYDSNNLMGICSSVAVLRQSLMAARTSSIISFATMLFQPLARILKDKMVLAANVFVA